MESLSVNKRIRSLGTDSIDKSHFFLIRQQQKREADGASLKFLYQFNGILNDGKTENCLHFFLLQSKNKNYFNTKYELNVKVNSLLTLFCGQV